MIQRRKKLCDIKCYDTGVVLLEPPCLNEMGEVYTNIDNRPLPNAPKLIGTQEAISCYLKLKSIADDFLDKFVCGIE